MMRTDEVTTHLQVMHTWVEYALEKHDASQLTPAMLKRMADWTDEIVMWIKERQQEGGI